jgi:hypothetical protein
MYSGDYDVIYGFLCLFVSYGSFFFFFAKNVFTCLCVCPFICVQDANLKFD